MQHANKLPATPWALEQNFRDKVPGELLTVLDICGKLLAGKDLVLIFGHTWIDIKVERSTWSTSKQLANAAKEALKPVFTDKKKAVMQECAKYLG